MSFISKLMGWDKQVEKVEKETDEVVANLSFVQKQMKKMVMNYLKQEESIVQELEDLRRDLGIK